MFCTNCGAEISVGDAECATCGKSFGEPSSVGPAIKYAEFLPRLVAYIADLPVVLAPVLLGVIIMRILLAAGLWIPGGADGRVPVRTWWEKMPWEHKLAAILTFIVAQGLLYFPLCHSSPWQATVGKRWRRIMVTDMAGDRISFLRAICRQLVKSAFSMLPIVGLTAQILSILITTKHQAIHDLFAKTVVICGRPSPDAHLGYWKPLVFLLAPTFLLVITFLWVT